MAVGGGGVNGGSERGGLSGQRSGGVESNVYLLLRGPMFHLVQTKNEWEISLREISREGWEN